MRRQDIFGYKRGTRIRRCSLARELAMYKPYIKVNLPEVQEETGEELWKKYLGVLEEPSNYTLNKPEVLRYKQLELPHFPHIW